MACEGLITGYPTLFFVGILEIVFFFFFSSRRRHTRWNCDWSSDVCSSDLRSRRAGTRHRRGRRLHQRAQIRGTHAGEKRLPREAGRRRPRGRGTCFATRLPPGDHRPRNAPHDGVRVDGAIAPEPVDATHSGDGRNFARRCQASRPCDEGRRVGLLNETGSGGSVDCGGRTTHGNGGATPGRARGVERRWQPLPRKSACSLWTTPPSCARCWKAFTTVTS